jgi:hypothetical protein
MAFPDLTDIRTRVRSLMNEDSNSTFLTDTILNRMINDAERDICIKTGCLENIDSVTTIASTRTVAFSGHKVKYLEYIGSTREGLQRVTPKHLGYGTFKGSTPQRWFQWGGTCVIDPMPGTTTYTLYQYVSDYPHTEMSSDTDEPAIPSSYYEDIIQFVLFRALLRDRKYQQAAFVYNKYIESIQAKKKIITAQQPDSRMANKIPDVVRDMQKGGQE